MLILFVLGNANVSEFWTEADRFEKIYHACFGSVGVIKFFSHLCR
jgi:hypothetical protein